MLIVIAQQKGGVGKTTTAANIAVLLARHGARVLIVDTDPQFALTRQLGLKVRSLGVSLVDVLAGRAEVGEAIVAGVHRLDVIPAAGAGWRRDQPRRGARSRTVPTRRPTARPRRLRARRHRHTSEPRAPDGQRARLCRPGPRSGECRGRGVAPRHPGAAPDRYQADRATRRPATRASRVAAPWQRHRISSRSAEHQLAAEGLAAVGRIPSRSALIARAAARRVPLALSDPDSSPALAYKQLAELLAGVKAR